MSRLAPAAAAEACEERELGIFQLPLRVMCMAVRWPSLKSRKSLLWTNYIVNTYFLVYWSLRFCEPATAHSDKQTGWLTLFTCCPPQE